MAIGFILQHLATELGKRDADFLPKLLSKVESQEKELLSLPDADQYAFGIYYLRAFRIALTQPGPPSLHLVKDDPSKLF